MTGTAGDTGSGAVIGTVGVIGLGDIGRGVATNVARAGLGLVVSDVRQEATEAFAGTARIAATPAEVAQLSEVVVIAVVNDAQLVDVLTGPNGALSSARPGTSFVVLSTVAAGTVRLMAAKALESGCGVVDCGVSGGPAAASEGQLVAMVGGSEEAVDRVRPVLDAFSSVVVHMGPAGAGLQAKLARNIVQYGSWLAAYEGQRLAEAAGIELSKLALAIRESDALIGGASRLMFRETVEPFGEDAHPAIVDAMRAGASLAHKDLRAALELAGELGVELPMAALTEDLCDDVFGLGAAQVSEPLK
jgi:3-hydroxyisobutyrate dehydrogenase-like beta-hydroxyacid dehydrogenase